MMDNLPPARGGHVLTHQEHLAIVAGLKRYARANHMLIVTWQRQYRCIRAEFTGCGIGGEASLAWANNVWQCMTDDAKRLEPMLRPPQRIYEQLRHSIFRPCT